MATHAQLLEGPIGPTLTRLAVPMGLGIIFIIALNLADTYFVGMLGTAQLAAMSFTFPVVSLVMSVVMGVGVGTTSAVSREIGAGDDKAIRKLATHAMMLAVLIVVFVSGIGLLTQDPVFRLLGADEQLLPLLREYMTVWYLGAAFLVVPMVGMGSIRASGDTRTPMFIMMTAAISNVALDPMFIFGFGPIPAMGLRGAAIATVLARSVTLVLALWVLQRKELLDLHVPTWTELRRSWGAILSVGLPAAVTNALAPVATAVLTWLIARHGTAAVAAYGVGSRLEGLLLIAPFALGAALTPFIGQNWGAHHTERVARGIVLARNFAMAWGAAAWVVLAVGGNGLAGLFADDPAVTQYAELYLWIVPLSYGAHGLVSVASASFNAVDKAVRATVLSALRSLVLAIPLAALGSATLGLPGVFVGIAVATVISAAIAYRWMQDLTRPPARRAEVELEGASPAVHQALEALLAGVGDLGDIDVHATRQRAAGFFVGDRELGHVHRGGQLDLAFPPEIRDQLIDEDKVDHHRHQHDSCWVTHRLDSASDVPEAIWLLRLAHALLRLAREPNESERELQQLVLSDGLRRSIDRAHARWAA
ncbi:MAG: MATE family efflux transporter [Deltaproteobacteria bacterium]|nr:MATE family efflux transporter [Deltaproteobacteria bacterium]